MSENKREEKENPQESSSEEKLEELTEKWKRAVADYENLQKRAEKEKRQLALTVTGMVVNDLLPVLDNISEAVEKTNDDGLKHIQKQFKEILKNRGVVEISAEGEDFDPEKHEAVEVVSGKKENKVVEVLRSGYEMSGKVLRPARVKVSKLENENENNKSTE